MIGVCERRLVNRFNITVCDIDNHSIVRSGSIWLRYDEEYLRVHTNCPLDYCQDTSEHISLTHPDEQCASNRTGVTCGACKDNRSIALGGSKCLQCTSNLTFVWLVALFAAAGVALVALLYALNMTISCGTLNGLIFYANIVSISGLTSLQNCSIHPILSVFIAWVNLDLGVETCFYPGMDTYQKTWLQLAFPLYIWLLVAAIIVASHYSSRAMKVFGRNNVAILATLFLLSYTKILKTIITALDFTEVYKSNASNVSDEVLSYKVWTYDGNLEYLKGKHVVLFSVALVLLLFLFLPYTLLLIFGQCVRSMRGRKRCVLWLIRSTAFISIMDAYHAPYNKKHRYWTGLMLLTCCVLYLAFVTPSKDGNIRANMYAITLMLFAILTLKMFTTKIYKNYLMGIVELASFLNLAVMSATVLLLEGNSSENGTLCVCTGVSISLCIAIFIGVLIFHTFLQVQKTRLYPFLKRILCTILPTGRVYKAIHDSSFADSSLKNVPTTSSVELREELLASIP